MSAYIAAAASVGIVAMISVEIKMIMTGKKIFFIMNLLFVKKIFDRKKRLYSKKQKITIKTVYFLKNA